MSKETLLILHLEDSPEDALLIEALLREEFPDLDIIRADTSEAFTQGLRNPAVRMVLSDYSLPAYDGISALAAQRDLRPELPFIFVSGAMGEDMAVECMKTGATDYVLKSNLKRLPSSIRRALSELDTRLTLLEAARVTKVVPWHWNEEDDTWLFGYLVKDILGYSAERLRGTPRFLREQVHGEDLPRFTAAFALVKDREQLDFDARLRHANGRWLWTRWTLAWTGGRCRGILQDITELHSAQDALIQSQRLEALGAMIGGITHDFGNLISALLGITELLSSSSLDPSQRQHVHILQRSCERAMEFKKELLRLVRKEEAPSRVSLDLNQVVREAMDILGHAVPKSMALVFDPAPGLPRIQGVPAQLLQVLMNLGINARDALGLEGCITLRTGLEHVSDPEAIEHGRPAGPYAFLEVEDTGAGIPDDVLPHIFEVFFTTKEIGKGTGLGLATVRAIVQQHDGVLKVETQAGKGSRFRALFPVN